MVKLTERLVLARSRASDLENVRKLNCWASDLTDISIIKKMQNVQIVSLSVNHITSLQDFVESLNLEELYIRKNDIANLAEIFHLRKLPRLRVLWLADNPCAVGDRYRMTVLKTLPNLQRLDNIPVHQDEVNEAIEQGLDITPLAETLKSIKSSPDSSPVQIRRSKKFKEKKDSENTEAKEKIESKEVNSEEKGKNETKNVKEDQVESQETEKVTELEDGGVEKVSIVTSLENDIEEDPKEYPESKEEEESLEADIENQANTSSPDRSCTQEKTPETESPTTEGSGFSRTGSDQEEEKRRNETETNITTEEEEEEVMEEEMEESDDIEEGEVTLENPILETNKIRAQLGMKPLPAEKVLQPTQSRPSHGTKARNSNILQAVLHLIKELDEDSLLTVSDVVRSRLDTL